MWRGSSKKTAVYFKRLSKTASDPCDPLLYSVRGNKWKKSLMLKLISRSFETFCRYFLIVLICTKGSVNVEKKLKWENNLQAFTELSAGVLHRLSTTHQNCLPVRIILFFHIFHCFLIISKSFITNCGLSHNFITAIMFEQVY